MNRIPNSAIIHFFDWLRDRNCDLTVRILELSEALELINHTVFILINTLFYTK